MVVIGGGGEDTRAGSISISWNSSVPSVVSSSAVAIVISGSAVAISAAGGGGADADPGGSGGPAIVTVSQVPILSPE